MRLAIFEELKIALWEQLRKNFDKEAEYAPHYHGLMMLKNIKKK